MRTSPARESGVHTEASGPVGRNATWQASRFASGSFTEIHLRARSLPGSSNAAESAYAHLLAALASQGASPADVIAEKFFLSDTESQAGEILSARSAFYRPGRGGTGAGPASTLVRQRPLGTGSTLEVKALALLTAGGRPVPSWSVSGLPPGVTGRAVEHGSLLLLHISGITGGQPGDDLPFDGQAASLFRRARTFLLQEGFDFRDVYRTWIYLADIDRDYERLNRARREFFTAHAVSPPPASTGIEGGPNPPDRLCTMDLRAVTGLPAGAVRPIHAPTLNEAPSYGADFSRGMRLDLGDRSLVHVSGTASIDDQGAIMHLGSISKQADRMLLNVERLLEGQGVGPGDMVTLTTYLKRPEFVEPFLEVAARRGFPDSVPHTICLAGVCRPGWLCEIEGLAIT